TRDDAAAALPRPSEAGPREPHSYVCQPAGYTEESVRPGAMQLPQVERDAGQDPLGKGLRHPSDGEAAKAVVALDATEQMLDDLLAQVVEVAHLGLGHQLALVLEILIEGRAFDGTPLPVLRACGALGAVGGVASVDRPRVRRVAALLAVAVQRQQ